MRPPNPHHLAQRLMTESPRLAELAERLETGLSDDDLALLGMDLEAMHRQFQSQFQSPSRGVRRHSRSTGRLVA